MLGHLLKNEDLLAVNAAEPHRNGKLERVRFCRYRQYPPDHGAERISDTLFVRSPVRRHCFMQKPDETRGIELVGISVEKFVDPWNTESNLEGGQRAIREGSGGILYIPRYVSESFQ